MKDRMINWIVVRTDATAISGRASTEQESVACMARLVLDREVSRHDRFYVSHGKRQGLKCVSRAVLELERQERAS